MGEEVMDEPSETIKEDIAENFSTKVVNVDPAQAHTVQKVIRKKIIKKIIVIDGKPVETEEVVEDPVDISTSEQFDTVDVDPTQNYSVQKVIRKRIIRKIVIVGGKPVETEEIIEDPVEVSTSEQFDTGNIDPAQDCSIQKVTRKRTLTKIVVIDGKHVENEEE